MAAPTNPRMGNGLDLGKQAQQTGKAVMDTAKQTMSNLGAKAEDATHAVGNRLQSFASTVRDQGPQQGVMGAATSSLAQGIDVGGAYLQTKGLKGLADDATELIRRNPFPALLAGVGLGFILARLTTRR